MKVHEKDKLNITFQTNEEMCKDLVMSLVDNALEKVEPQTDTVADGNEDMSNKRLGLKRVFDDSRHNTIDVQALRKSINKDELGYKQKI